MHRKLLHLIERRQAAGIAPFPLQLLLVQAEVVHQSATSDRPPEQVFLLRGRVDSEPIGPA